MLHDHSIICFGGEDWWYHHPHSKSHLMRRFARAGNKVIFVNSISTGMVSVWHKAFLPRVTRKLRSYAKLARTTDEGTMNNARPSLKKIAVASAAIFVLALGVRLLSWHDSRREVGKVQTVVAADYQHAARFFRQGGLRGFCSCW